MSRRQGRSAGPGDEARKLPESGLAGELLAHWQDGEPLASPAAAGAAMAVSRGPDRLYDLADHLSSRGAAADEAPPETPETWVALEAAGEVYALPVERVEEVLRVSGITRLPYAPAPVRGITQQRGRVLTVVDLRVRLGFAPAPLDARSRICVVSSRGRSIGLLVDGARHVFKLLPSGRQPPPPEAMSERSGFIVGVYRLDDALAILVDVDRALLLTAEPAPGQGLMAAAP